MVGYANLEALAYCYELTGDRKYIEQGLGTLSQAINWILNPTHDKGIVLWMRMLRGPFRFMAIAHDLGLMQKIPESGPWAR